MGGEDSFIIGRSFDILNRQKGDMAIINKLLLRQLYHIYKRQGPIDLCSYFVKSFNYLIINKYFRGSFSQKGEDLTMDKFFKHKRKGFYIDIGACHPKRFNNTKFFYDRGWHGINIEPMPTRIKLFLQERKRDKNLNIGIGKVKKVAVFYEFEASGFSTFSKKEADSLIKIGYPLKRKIKVQMHRLEDIMKKYVTSHIDFMTIDTEAMDLDVLESNDWKKYRPKLLCVETIDFIDLLTSTKENSNRKKSISNYLLGNGYQEYFSNGLNTLYRDIRN